MARVDEQLEMKKEASEVKALREENEKLKAENQRLLAKCDSLQQKSVEKKASKVVYISKGTQTKEPSLQSVAVSPVSELKTYLKGDAFEIEPTNIKLEEADTFESVQIAIR